MGFAIVTGGEHIARAWQALAVLAGIVLALAAGPSGLHSLLALLPRAWRKLTDWPHPDGKERR